MSTIRQLEIGDRPLVEAYLRRYPPEVSELTFTNLFVWRNSRPIFLAEVEDSLVFLVNAGKNSNGEKLVFAPPLGEASPLTIANALDTNVVGFVRIPEKTANVFREANLAVVPDEDNSDYVFRITDLAELPGRRYHKKRNLIKQCHAAYECEYESMTPELIAECSDMQDRWCQARQCRHDPGLCSEFVAIREMFEHFEELELIGGAIRIDGAIQAYAVGEELGPKTAVCHFEKSMSGFRGLGQLINQWFAKYGLQGFEYENREQDLGIPGLRQAKRSYYPHHMVNKFNAWFSPAASNMPVHVEPRECEKHG